MTVSPDEQARLDQVRADEARLEAERDERKRIEQERVDTLKAARDYVWKSFDLHFKQRTEFIRFYLTMLVPIFAAYGFVLKERLYFYGMLVAALAVVITVLFWLLDLETRGFMGDYRKFLEDDETQMAAILQNPKIRLFHQSDNRRRFGYRGMIYGFYTANILLSVVVFGYCLCASLRT
jgi:hypothetical protein